MLNTGPLDSDRIARLERRVDAIEQTFKNILAVAKTHPLIRNVAKNFIDLTKIEP